MVSAFQYYLFIICSAFFGVGLILALFLPSRKIGAEAIGELRLFLWLALGYLVCNSLEITAPNEATTLFFASISYAFIGGIPVAVFLFALRFSGRALLAIRLRPLQWIIPAIEVLIVSTNAFHHLHWISMTFVHVGPFISMRATGYGFLFWAMWVCLESFAISSVVFLFSSVITRSRAFNRQTLIILTGALIPWLFNAVYVLRLIPDLRKDFTPISYAITAILFAVGSYYDRLFDLIPIARSALVEVLADPIVAVDYDGRIIDANPAARIVCGLPDHPAGTLMAANPFLWSIVSRLEHADHPLTEASPEGKNWYEVRSTEVRAGDRTLRLYSMRDITDRRRLMEEKSDLIERLSRALTDIRTLEGIVPICASCKKVRDDTGYWQQVESYVSSHTMAEFSHGICPECSARLYPDLDLDGTEGRTGA
jgi:two-component system, NtrC family, sensor kinase